MFRGLLDLDRNYVLDLVEGDDRKRFLRVRLAGDSVEMDVKHSSRAYGGNTLMAWRSENKLPENVELVDGTRFSLGPHGDWITEAEFAAWTHSMNPA